MESFKKKEYVLLKCPMVHTSTVEEGETPQLSWSSVMPARSAIAWTTSKQRVQVMFQKYSNDDDK